jgi:hypothetical protein
MKASFTIDDKGSGSSSIPPQSDRGKRRLNFNPIVVLKTLVF